MQVLLGNPQADIYTKHIIDQNRGEKQACYDVKQYFQSLYFQSLCVFRF